METAKVLRILVFLCYVPCCVSQNISIEDTNSSCVTAEPPVSLATKNASCIYYQNEIGICNNIISSRYIFASSDDLTRNKQMIGKFEAYLSLVSEECKSNSIDMYCRYLFPLCDVTLSKPHARGICRKTCKFTLEVKCKKEFAALKTLADRDPTFDKKMISCMTFPAANGGQAPECYQYHTIPGDDTRSTDCYHGIGVGYRGNVNTTRSGRSCQQWSLQCPHRHLRIPEDVHGQNDSNMCRNPDGSAPDGPWCYTTDPNVRWEYCNISRCPARVPAEGPSFLKGFPLNSTAIHISWKSIPPSAHKEPLLGYRIKYKHLGSGLYSEMNVTSNVTEAVMIRLGFQTRYEIKVNGFNEIGHGPPGNILVVTTLQLGDILMDINLKFVINADFHNDLLNGSSDKFEVMERNIRSSIIRQFNESSVFKIYEVRVLRFSHGSVKAHILVSATVNALTSKVELITRLMEGFDPAFKESLGISAIIVAEKPPRPGTLQATNVQTQYMILSWEKPQYGSNYQIQNYTVERKKEGLDGIVVKTLPYTRTGMMMENLEPATGYTIRLSSSNNYGTSDGVLLTQATLPDTFIAKLMLTIVLPLSLAVLFIIIVCLKFRPTCRTKPRENEQIVLCKRGDWLELPRSAVQLQEKLGEGAFGEVYKGVVRISGQAKNYAVKKLKENATETEKRDLRNELQIMATVGEHPNVISLIGACTEEEPVLVVVRLAQNGCLLNHLQKNRENTYINVNNQEKKHFAVNDRVRIARDIANGMLHLSNKKCVHRDLAARNVLLDENFVAMVSDFGLSRDVYESGEYETISGGLLPVRWMALDSLVDYTYNTKTDVWSFGVVLWEIQSGGIMPYSGLGGMEVVDFLKSGQRLKQPAGCPDEIYDIMTSCWHPDPSQRPSFSGLVTSLEQELNAKKEYQDLPNVQTPENEFAGCTDLASDTNDPTHEENCNNSSQLNS